MTDASHQPVDGAEPRSAPDPVADPRTPDPAGGHPAERAVDVPEPSDGEALAPADERVPPASGGGPTAVPGADAGVAPSGGPVDGGGGGGGPDDAPGGGGTDGGAGSPVDPGGPGRDGTVGPADGPLGAGAGGAEGGTGAVDVAGGAGIGSPEELDVAPDPSADQSSATDAGPAMAPGDDVPAVDDVPGGPGIGTDEPGGVVPGGAEAGSAAVEAGTEGPAPIAAGEAADGGSTPADGGSTSADGGAASADGGAAAADDGAVPVDGGAEEIAPVAAERSDSAGGSHAAEGSDTGAAGVAEAGTAVGPPPDAGGERAPGGATGPAPAAAPSAALPPPPPELAEVPADAGRVVTGRVREVAGEDVIVDLDDGRVGVINRRNLGADAEPSSVVSPGDAIEGAVLARSDPQHRVVLSRTWALKKRAWEAVAAAAAENAVLTGTVVSVGQKGVVVDVGVRGFVPASHLEIGPVADLQRYAGQELSLRVLDVDTERERLVLSRRSQLLKEQRRSVHDILSALQPGEVRRGKVASLSDYGAFVDLGGVNGLVHLSELSWQRVRHPSEVVEVGDEVDVKVLDVKVKKRRVSLSIRQLTDDPLGSLVPGDIRTGPVTRLVDFGAFVDLSGVEGLVHLSELAEYRVSAPEEIVAPGEEVRVKVLSVDRRRRRVELSIRRAAEYGG